MAAWTAPPLAPLQRLSIAQIEMTVLVRSSYLAVRNDVFVPRAALVEGDVGRTTTNGSS